MKELVDQKIILLPTKHACQNVTSRLLGCIFPKLSDRIRHEFSSLPSCRRGAASRSLQSVPMRSLRPWTKRDVALDFLVAEHREPWETFVL
jgi:hypothetical protein